MNAAKDEWKMPTKHGPVRGVSIAAQTGRFARGCRLKGKGKAEEKGGKAHGEGNSKADKESGGRNGAG